MASLTEPGSSITATTRGIEVVVAAVADVVGITAQIEPTSPPAELRPGQALWTDDQPGSTNRGFLRAVWPTTEFVVQLDGTAVLEVRLICRVRAPGEIQVTVGAWSAIASVSTTWTSVKLRIPADAAAPGLRALQVSWPHLKPGARRWSQPVHALADDRPGELHPIFGEVHSLTARQHRVRMSS